MTPAHNINTAPGVACPTWPTASVRVQTALTALTMQFCDVVTVQPDTDEQRAQRSAALALISARRAGWWGVLITGDRHIPPLYRPAPYRTALRLAREHERRQARFWRESAQDWQARADGRPTSDAAGALSNWDELGVTA